MTSQSIPLDQVAFNNPFVEELRGDESGIAGARQVPGYCYSRIAPTPVADPHLLAWSDELGEFLGLAKPAERGPAVDALAGNLITPSMKPFAARYGGHQFGNWAGQLGDGRAISLGQVSAVDGSHWEIQLKGAGPTPYSRRGDGRAVLRSSLREFLCSEAMYHLGVPTTRALSLVVTGDTVMRDMFYTGNVQPEPGAIVARVAPTFVRFGNFQLLAASGEIDNLRALADYVLRHHYPDLGPPSPAVYVRWFAEVAQRTAVMVAHWMTVGFVHGVLNTDNMSILGLTIDYGPYGWLEPYEPDWTPNTTDFSSHRYAFGQQPRIAMWNLMALAQSLTPLVEDPQALRAGLDAYAETLASTQHTLWLRKLGLTPQSDVDDIALTESLPVALTEAGVDMTIFFRQLSHLVPKLLSSHGNVDELLHHLVDQATYSEDAKPNQLLLDWLARYTQRLKLETDSPESIWNQMLATNPKYVLRNYLAQQVIEAAEVGNLVPLTNLFEILKTPFAEHQVHEHLAAKRPIWARDKPGSATLSCSS
jgi:uncharacterized protein YdiU (UPF0061 family)